MLPVSVTKFVPSPMITFPLLGVKPATSDSCWSNACTSVPIVRPKDALAVAPDSVTQVVPSETINLLSS